ncbi:MAG TPA: agmatinase [Gemmatimonadales bacterium]|nr:agmatinase [Gemmatimonadales bacterium]
MPSIQAGPVALVGLPYDGSSSFLRGAAEAPPLLRAALAAPSSNTWTESLRDLGHHDRIHDAGDVSLPDGPGAREKIEAAIAELLDRGFRPLSLGGDHSVTYPILRAFRGRYPRLTILHLDAHPDLYDELDGDRYSHACPFARIMEEGLATRLVQVGIRTMSGAQRPQAERFNVEVHDMRSWRDDTPLSLGTGPLYVSLDLDVLDPAFAPGISHYEPGGMSVRQVLHILQSLPPTIVGADLVEFNPRRDINGMTAMVGGKLMKELLDRMLAAGDGD